MAIGHAPTFSVSEFVAVFNQSLDMIFPSVTVIGELSSYRVSKGTWVYFDLKDDAASVKFFGSVRVLPGPLEDGMMLEVAGRPYLHPKFGFSVQIESITPVGKGTIKQAKDLLAQKLKGEGLFDDIRKRSLPYPPTKIALISSVESAGYSDFIKIVSSRWPMLQIDTYDVLVQGQHAPEQIVFALDSVNQHADTEVVVIVRGGGSADDLIAFDHEQVVRAIASSRVPTLVAIGHERDLSLAELASDQRASTPSNAGELLVPDVLTELETIRVAYGEAKRLLTQSVQRERAERDHLVERASRELLARLESSDQQFRSTKSVLALLDPRLPLSKGYALARAKSGAVIRDAKTAKLEESFALEFADDTITVEAKKS